MHFFFSLHFEQIEECPVPLSTYLHSTVYVFGESLMIEYISPDQEFSKTPQNACGDISLNSSKGFLVLSIKPQLPYQNRSSGKSGCSKDSLLVRVCLPNSVILPELCLNCWPPAETLKSSILSCHVLFPRNNKFIYLFTQHVNAFMSHKKLLGLEIYMRSIPMQHGLQVP